MPRQAILLTAAFFLLAGFSRADWKQVESMHSGAPILVRAGFITDAGKFVNADANTVTVQTQSGQVTVKKADVDAVFVFRSHAERVHRSLLFGGIAAGVTAAAFFPWTASFVHPNYILPSITTATDGAAWGLVGSLNRYKRIYRHD